MTLRPRLTTGLPYRGCRSENRVCYAAVGEILLFSVPRASAEPLSPET